MSNTPLELIVLYPKKYDVILQSTAKNKQALIQMIIARVGFSFTRKHSTWLERLARDKHSILLQKSVIYGCNTFYDKSPWTEMISHKLFCAITLTKRLFLSKLHQTEKFGFKIVCM